MGFPEDILTEDEQLAMHLHPHWTQMLRPVLILLLGIAAAVAGFLWLPAGSTGDILLYVIVGLALILVLWLTVVPWIVWRTTHYIFTTERVVLQHGVLRRERRDIPLQRVNDHTMNQSLLERMLGTGTLVIESAGERGQSLLRHVPKVQRVQTLLYELVDTYHDKHSLGDDEMRDIMSQLQDGGDKPKQQT